MSDNKVVYLIRHPEGFVKIGRSSDPESRLSDIQPYSPYDLEVFTTIEQSDEGGRTGKTLEGQLHHYYRRFRVRGEWFDLPEKEINALDELDELAVQDLEAVQYDHHNTPSEDGPRTVYHHLRDVWALKYRGERDEP